MDQTMRDAEMPRHLLVRPVPVDCEYYYDGSCMYYGDTLCRQSCNIREGFQTTIEEVEFAAAGLSDTEEYWKTHRQRRRTR